jgi:asparagine synthase (glutamine-hydrolysing)
VRDLLAPDDVEKRGLFNPRATAHLIKKIEGGIPLGESDDMALVGVLSSQLVHRLFVEDFQLHPPLSDRDNVKVCYGQGITIPA